MNFEELQSLIGVRFQNKRLLEQAFTHSSYVNENRNLGIEDNERLEFLGDAVLELTVSRFLFLTFPEMSEGEMTKLRASIVCEESLVRFAQALDFSDLVLLGKGEEMTGGRHRPALLADAFESFVGALYLDTDVDTVYRFLEAYVFPELDKGTFTNVKDYKSRLQERVQEQDLGELSYSIVNERGPAHNREFVSHVCLNRKELGTGSGRTKKEAEQQAAAQALNRLGVR